jgi:hypothetical protein
MIRDPAAVEPLMRILGGGDDDARHLTCDILCQIPGDEAARLLARYALADNAEPVRLAAIKAIQSRSDRAALQPLVNGLNGSAEVMRRAAFALGEIGDLATAPALLAHLRKAENRVAEVPAPDEPEPSMFNGTVIAYVAGAHSVVSNGAAAVVPEIGYMGAGSGFGGGPEPTTVLRPYIAWVTQPHILEALKKVTGQDFGYNPGAWQDWIGKALEREKAAGGATTLGPAKR